LLFSHNWILTMMRSRTRRSPRPSPRLNLETLESRTLLAASGHSSLAEAMFATSYAALHLRPAAEPAEAPRAARTATAATTTAGLSRVAKAAPPTFLESLHVVSNADGTSAAIIDYQSSEAGIYSATAR
jgi:hypothetical protein